MPAIACDATSLLDASKCLDQIPPGRMDAVMIYLLAQIAGVSTDPTSLMDNAKCIDAVIPKGMRDAVIVSLLCSIANADGA
jgi:hypothetical protein